jgi:hypothetical protein
LRAALAARIYEEAPQQNAAALGCTPIHLQGELVISLRRIFAGLATRFPGARVGARLGLVAATLSGLAIAFDMGGSDGYALPLSYLMGAPTNGLIFRALSFVMHLRPDLVTSTGPSSHWDWYHVLFCGCIALNWTLLGLLVDVTRPEPVGPPALRSLHQTADEPKRLLEPTFGPLEGAFKELERRKEPTRVDSPRRAA